MKFLSNFKPRETLPCHRT